MRKFKMNYLLKLMAISILCIICYAIPYIIGDIFYKDNLPLFMFWGGTAYMFFCRIIMRG
jgi:hypothetical protein